MSSKPVPSRPVHDQLRDGMGKLWRGLICRRNYPRKHSLRDIAGDVLGVCAQGLLLLSGGLAGMCAMAAGAFSAFGVYSVIAGSMAVASVVAPVVLTGVLMAASFGCILASDVVGARREIKKIAQTEDSGKRITRRRPPEHLRSFFDKMLNVDFSRAATPPAEQQPPSAASVPAPPAPNL